MPFLCRMVILNGMTKINTEYLKKVQREAYTSEVFRIYTSYKPSQGGGFN